MRFTGLPPEVLMDLALELIDIASRKLAPSPIKRTALGLGTARWRHVGANRAEQRFCDVPRKHDGPKIGASARTGDVLKQQVSDADDDASMCIVDVATLEVPGYRVADQEAPVRSVATGRTRHMRQLFPQMMPALNGSQKLAACTGTENARNHVRFHRGFSCTSY